MSLTKTSAGQYFSIDQFNWTLPCTLEIKFSTCGAGSGSYWSNPTLLGNEHSGHWAGDWGIATTSGYIYVWSGDGSQGYVGKLVNDKKPHTVRVCIDASSMASVYVDGEFAHKMHWNCPWGANYLGFNGVDGASYTQAPTTWYYIKFANDYLTEPHIKKADCSVYYTWDSDGNIVRNGTPIGKLNWGEHDDVTLDTFNYPTYKHDLDLYGKKK